MKPIIQKTLKILGAVAILSLWIALVAGISFVMEHFPSQFMMAVGALAALVYILLLAWVAMMLTLSFKRSNKGMVLDSFLATIAARVALPILYIMTFFYVSISYDSNQDPQTHAYVVSILTLLPAIGLVVVSLLIRTAALKTSMLVLAACSSILTILVSPALIEKTLDYFAESWLFRLHVSRGYVTVVIEGLLIYSVYRLSARLLEWYEYNEIARIADTFHKRGSDDWKLIFEHQLKAREFMRSLHKSPLAEKSRELFPDDYVLQKADYEMRVKD